MSIHSFIRSRSVLGVAFAATVIAYSAIAWFATNAAIAAHSPCITDFEGGCGYGKAWAGALSWLAACIAISPAIGIGASALVIPRFKACLIAASVVLASPPVAYVLYGIYKVTPVAQ
jgi:hypothetical protein